MVGKYIVFDYHKDLSLRMISLYYCVLKGLCALYYKGIQSLD
jgi:hypothetical protein